MRLSTIVCAAVGAFTCANGQEKEQAALLGEGDMREDIQPLNVAIIGAGAGGASAAYHLSKFAAEASVPIIITLFERNSTAGGRSTTVNAYNNPSIPIELGASIFVKVNSILNDAVKEFNLSTKEFMPDVPVPGPALGVWDGEEFVVKMSSGWWDTAKLLWKYGLAPIKTMRLMKKVVGKFLEMYDAPLFPFEDLTQVARAQGLLDVTAATGEQYLEDNGITGNFGREVVQASTRVNYANNLRYIHGLETMVCMAAEGGMSVRGGNWQIFDNMIAASNAAALYSTEVRAIEKQKNGSYSLTFASAESGPQGYDLSTQHQLFDSVILAAPYQFSDLDISPSVKSVPEKIPYVKLHVTLFTSPHLPSPSFFDLPKDQKVPRAILTTLPTDEEPLEGAAGVGSPGFFSISLLRPVTNPHTGVQEYAYKIFSAEPPNSTFLSHLLGLSPPSPPFSSDEGINSSDISWIYRKLWHSYPYESPRKAFERIELAEGLWYLNGMEAFISAMEAMALMGRNVAKLVVERWEEEVGGVVYGGLLEKEMAGMGLQGDVADVVT